MKHLFLILLTSMPILGYCQVDAATTNSMNGGFTNWDKMAQYKDRELDYATRRADLAEQHLAASREAIYELNLYMDYISQNHLDNVRGYIKFLLSQHNGDVLKLKNSGGFYLIEDAIRQEMADQNKH